MDRVPRHFALALADASAAAGQHDGPDRVAGPAGEHGGAKRCLLALWAGIGLVVVMLLAAAGPKLAARNDAVVPASSFDARAIVVDVASTRCETEASQVPRDGRDRPSEEERAALESEKKDDDEDGRSGVSMPWSASKSIRNVGHRRPAWCVGPAADTGHPLVSTGLARGPPHAA